MARHPRSDISQTDDAPVATFQFDPDERLPLLITHPHARISRGKHPTQAEQQGEGELTHGTRIGCSCVCHHHAAFGRGRYVQAVHSHPVSGKDPQTAYRLDDPLRHGA